MASRLQTYRVGAVVGAKLPMGAGYQSDDAEATVIGVVDDVRYQTAADTARPEMYYSFRQFGGQIAMLMATPTAFTQHIRAGRLKAIAVTIAKRFQTMPDVPTLAESGVPGFDHVEWWMFVGPARIPTAVEAKLHKDLSAVVSQADFKSRVLELDIETFANTREASQAFLRRELARWAWDAKLLGMMP